MCHTPFTPSSVHSTLEFSPSPYIDRQMPPFSPEGRQRAVPLNVAFFSRPSRKLFPPSRVRHSLKAFLFTADRAFSFSSSYDWPRISALPFPLPSPLDERSSVAATHPSCLYHEVSSFFSRVIACSTIFLFFLSGRPRRPKKN